MNLIKTNYHFQLKVHITYYKCYSINVKTHFLIQTHISKPETLTLLWDSTQLLSQYNCHIGTSKNVVFYSFSIIKHCLCVRYLYLNNCLVKVIICNKKKNNHRSYCKSKSNVIGCIYFIYYLIDPFLVL